MTTFTAKFASAHNLENVLLAGLADHQFDTEKYILFQKQCGSDFWDALEEDDEIEITFVDQFRSASGGIESIVLTSEGIWIQVTSATASRLATDSEILVHFHPDLVGLDDFATALGRMVGDKFSDRRARA